MKRDGMFLLTLGYVIGYMLGTWASGIVYDPHAPTTVRERFDASVDGLLGGPRGDDVRPRGR